MACRNCKRSNKATTYEFPPGLEDMVFPLGPSVLFPAKSRSELVQSGDGSGRIEVGGGENLEHDFDEVRTSHGLVAVVRVIHLCMNNKD